MPVTCSWVLSMSACSALRSGLNQKPLYTSSAYLGIRSSCE